MSHWRQPAGVHRPYIPRYREESEDGGISVYGGYGPRLLHQRGNNQIQNVITLLRERPTSRRAVIQILNAEDIGDNHSEIPCTTALQFFVRNACVHLIASMRSNDAFIGFPHDVFCFTMLQEIVARAIDLEVGSYRHFVGSMHLYDTDRLHARNLIEEGFNRASKCRQCPSATLGLRLTPFWPLKLEFELTKARRKSSGPRPLLVRPHQDVADIFQP